MFSNIFFFTFEIKREVKRKGNFLYLIITEKDKHNAKYADAI